MPTHTQLRLVPRTETEQPPNEVAQVAIQTDGYPGAAVRELLDLVGLLTATPQPP